MAPALSLERERRPAAAPPVSSKLAVAPDVLRVEDLTLQYKTPNHLVTATYQVGFQVHEQDRYVLLGPSGCGKSTILKAVAGFMPVAGGSIALRGKPVTTPGPDRMMVFQEFEQLMPWKTVLGNVLFPMQATGRFKGQDAHDRACAAIDKVKLSKFRDAYPHMLSGGMKMRVAIARAMAMEPDILLMDEPFAALDALTRRKMQQELLELWDNVRFTLMFVTHSIEEAIIVGSRILVLSPHPGRVRAEIDASVFDMSSLDAPEFGALAKRLHGLLFEHEVEADVLAARPAGRG